MPSILRRVGIRQLPGICLYPAKCMVFLYTMNQGGTASFQLVLDNLFVEGGLFLLMLQKSVSSRKERVSLNEYSRIFGSKKVS